MAKKTEGAESRPGDPDPDDMEAAFARIGEMTEEERNEWLCRKFGIFPDELEGATGAAEILSKKYEAR
jgi:hypothetical protein